MKKIFAIALAVVMVLSMASAFALNVCSTGAFSWDCETDPSNCGKGSVEIVPYVVENTACDGWQYVQSDCATAINTQQVFFAVKVYVEENADLDWWEAAKLTFETKGVTVPAALSNIAAPNMPICLAIAEDDEAQVWYYLGNNIFVNEEDVEDIKTVMWTGNVTEADSAKVCAKLESEHSGLGVVWAYGDYRVKASANATWNGVAYDYVIAFADKAGDNKVAMCIEDGVIALIDNTGATAKFYNEVVAAFNLNACAIGTCINADNIKANFGWKDKIEDCFKWSDKGASVVDTDCVVAIPKTGDASVLAWLF